MTYPTTVAEQEEHLFQVINSERFIRMEGLHAEIPVFIYPYDATKQLEVEKATTRVKNRLLNSGTPVLEVNLHEVAISLLEARGVLDLMIEAEPETESRFFEEDLRAMLDPREHLVPAIKARVSAADTRPKTLLLTGVGGIYPVIRSHTVLETIQDLARDLPVVLFFPGTYERSSSAGSTLSLFGHLHDDRYYRARDILSQEA
ncbi:DUF1788 domain-containing protein (plasmid) [Coraliomargarita sp. W4R53]